MTNEMHRPGPWSVIPGHEYGEYWLQEEIEAEDGEHDEANARLMSYAPAMAQALSDVLEWQARMGGFEGEVWDQARAALYAARGWQVGEARVGDECADEADAGERNRCGAPL